MPPQTDVPQIVSRRHRRRLRSQQGIIARSGKVGIVLAILISVALAVSLIWGAGVYGGLSADLPSIETLPLLLDLPNGQLLQPTRIYDRSGETLLLSLENPNAADARYLSLEEIPQVVIDATLAASDPDFWEHGGFRWRLDEDHPTLAQQLVGDLLLGAEPDSPERSLRLSLLAAQATHDYGRQKILEWRLNTAPYGQLAFGVDEAAWVYFGKSAVDLSLAEAALLAATAQAPALNPIDAPELAVERQGRILQAMLAQGYLTPEEALNANASPINLQHAAVIPQTIAPDFLDLVLDQLTRQFGEGRVQRGGLVIVSTLDSDLQQAAACAAQTQLARLNGTLAPNQLDQPDCEAARLLPVLQSDSVVGGSALDANVIVLDPATGHILALVGDPRQTHTPGTSLNPLIYLTAFIRGLSPASLVWDIPANLPPDLGSFGNLDGEFRGPISIRTALANGYIVPALEVLTQIGPANAWHTAQQSGLESLAIPNDLDAYRLVLDRGLVSLIDLAQAYGMLADGGVLAGQAQGGAIQPSAILLVKDISGRVMIDHSQPDVQPVVPAQLAYLITDILSDDLARRDSLGHPNPLETGRPAAGMIGQSYLSDSTWTLGYSPQLVVGVWIGAAESGSEDLPKVPAIAAAGLWNAIMKSGHADLPLASFQEPPGLRSIAVCDPSGLLPTLDCPKVVTGLFVNGTEPIIQDNLYQSYPVNTQTGRLATVYTPPEYVEDRVFLIVPAEAADWARQAGLEVPPDSYDVVFNPSGGSGVAAISFPEIFAYVSGEVIIRGRAAGDSFAYYRVQIGEGLNPRQWLQIGEDRVAPVEDGDLVLWDTTGLNGLYAIQLLVVKQDQSVETAIIQVTVDNQSPQVQVTLPFEGQEFTYPQESHITIQAQVSDNLGVASVEFFVDGELVSRLVNAPYAAPWEGALGEHQLRIVVTDLAGNQTETTLSFTIKR